MGLKRMAIEDPASGRELLDRLTEIQKRIRAWSKNKSIVESQATRNAIAMQKPVTDALTALTTKIAAPLEAILEHQPRLEAALLDREDRYLEGPAASSSRRGSVDRDLGELAKEGLTRYFHKQGDKTFGLKTGPGQTWSMGDEKVIIQGDDLVIGDITYKGTPGLWDLITNKEPQPLHTYPREDQINYAAILRATDAMYSRNKQTGEKLAGPAATKSAKYKSVIKPIWSDKDQTKYDTARSFSGSGLCDPNDMVSRLQLLMAAKEAGNSSVAMRNEATGIIDKLYRKEWIDAEIYKNLVRNNL